MVSLALRFRKLSDMFQLTTVNHPLPGSKALVLLACVFSQFMIASTFFLCHTLPNIHVRKLSTAQTTCIRYSGYPIMPGREYHLNEVTIGLKYLPILYTSTRRHSTPSVSKIWTILNSMSFCRSNRRLFPYNSGRPETTMLLDLFRHGDFPSLTCVS